MMAWNKKATTETLVKNGVRQYLRIKGWFVFNIVQNAFSHPGIADIVAVRSGKVLWIECKGPKGKQSEAQKLFEQNITAAGGLYLLVRDFEELKRMDF
jgi:Holliday junction resolvase